jgi:hypothetical protein
MQKHTRTFTDDDGVISIWEYDPDKTNSGPYEVTMKYPKDFMTSKPVERVLSKTEQRYLNPYTGKYISYQRYQQLIKEGKIKLD